MLKINLAWRGPLYKEIYNYAQRRDVKCVDENCKTLHLLNIDIKGVHKEAAEVVLDELMIRLHEEADMGNGEGDILLSKKAWGISSIYNEETHTYTDVICIDKDFDDLDMQKKMVMKLIRGIAKEVKCELVNRHPQLYGSHFYYDIDL